MKTFGWITLAGSAVLISGCAVGPDYHRPSVEVPPNWKEATPADHLQKGAWWELFHDPVLNGLEQQAAQSNPDLQAAMARVNQARAVARVSLADLFPSLSVDPSASRFRDSANRPVPGAGAGKSFTSFDYKVPLDLSYEIDIWGRVRRAFEGATARAQASAADYETIRLTMHADVAQNYFLLRSLDLQERLLRDTLKAREDALNLVRIRFQKGASGEIDVVQAETELTAAQAQLYDVQKRRADQEHALAILCGRPASVFSIAPDEKLPGAPEIPVGLPSDLLERRPDVAEAERQLAAANADIGVAIGAFFPAVRLTGNAGVESVSLTSLFNWESRAWSIGPSISFPIFEAGRDSAELKRVRAAYDEAVDRYRSRVLVAFREVEDGLTGTHFLGLESEAQARSVESARRALDLSNRRYRGGIASYLEVIDSERTLLQSEIQEAQVQGQQLAATVALIKALGGGWAANPQLTLR